MWITKWDEDFTKERQTIRGITGLRWLEESCVILGRGTFQLEHTLCVWVCVCVYEGEGREGGGGSVVVLVLVRREVWRRPWLLDMDKRERRCPGWWWYFGKWLKGKSKNGSFPDGWSGWGFLYEPAGRRCVGVVGRPWYIMCPEWKGGWISVEDARDCLIPCFVSDCLIHIIHVFY